LELLRSVFQNQKLKMTVFQKDQFPNAKALGELFFSNNNIGQTIDWNSYLPLYIRSSEAEENLRLRSSEKS
jgi:hypothetical protein